MKSRPIWTWTGLAGIGLACSLALFAKPVMKKIEMKSEIKEGGRMSDDIFRIKTEDYFGNPMRGFSTIGSKLEDDGFDGLAIGGPEYIPVGSRGKFPLAIMNVTDARDASMHLFDDYAILTAMDLHTGKLYVDMVVEQKYVKPERNPSANPPPPGRSSDGAAVDLFKRLNIPQSIGEYLVTGILWDRASNRIHVKVGTPEFSDSDQKFKHAILKRFENEIEMDSIPTNISVRSEVVNPNSPVLPVKTGIHIFIEQKIEMSQDKFPCLLEGSIRVQDPVLKSGMVLKNNQAPRFIPVTILATGSRYPQPLVFRMKVRVKPDPKSENGSILIGYFSVDLNQFGWLKSGQKYSIYAFADSLMNGPTRLEITEHSKK